MQSAYVNSIKIQPIIPLNMGKVSLINRLTIEILNTSEHAQKIEDAAPGAEKYERKRQTRLGAFNYAMYFGPSNEGKFIWAVGPTITILPDSQEQLTSLEKDIRKGIDDMLLGVQDKKDDGEYHDYDDSENGQKGRDIGLGLSVVGLSHVKKITVGALVSATGFLDKKIYEYVIQPFFNFRLHNGLYISFNPEIKMQYLSYKHKKDDKAEEEEIKYSKYEIPLGLGFGKVFHAGSTAINMQAGYYYQINTFSKKVADKDADASLKATNAEHEIYANTKKLIEKGEHQIKLQLQFLIPKKINVIVIDKNCNIAFIVKISYQKLIITYLYIYQEK